MPKHNVSSEYPAVGRPWPVECSKCDETRNLHPDLPEDGLATQHYLYHGHNVSDSELEQALLEILEPHYWNQGFKDGKAAAKKSHTFKMLTDLVHKEREAAKFQAYDEALFDSGYDKTQVGPVTREIVDGKRQKYRIAAGLTNKEEK